jgi:hypothetical protein
MIQTMGYCRGRARSTLPVIANNFYTVAAGSSMLDPYNEDYPHDQTTEKPQSAMKSFRAFSVVRWPSKPMTTLLSG